MELDYFARNESKCLNIDTATDKDVLGFKPYVDAIAEYLTDKCTLPPITLSIEGQWGCGKSSFMKQLKENIEMRNLSHVEIWIFLKYLFAKDNKETSPELATLIHILTEALRLNNQNPYLFTNKLKAITLYIDSKIKRKKYFTVWFNSWKCEKDEELWASFALNFMDELSKQLSWVYRQYSSIKLLHLRYKLKLKSNFLVIVHFFWSIFSFILIFSFLSLIFTYILHYLGMPFPKFLIEWMPFPKILNEDFFKNFSHLVLILAPLVALLNYFSTEKRFIDVFRDPFGLKKLESSTNYWDRISFREHFHSDFNKIIESYVGNSKVYVFIDDLDRCEVPKAAELMQAINLMTLDDSKVYFSLGLDRKIISAGFAAKNEKIIECLGIQKMEYGSEFIEKFIQLPFKVPSPKDKDLKGLLYSQQKQENSSFKNLLDFFIPKLRTYFSNWPSNIDKNFKEKTEEIEEIAKNAQPVEETSKVDLKEEIKEIAENAQPVEETPKVDLKEEIKEIAENAQPVEETSKVDLKEEIKEIAENAQPVEETPKVDLKEIAENAQPVEETSKVDLKEEIKEIAENAQPVEETPKVDLKEEIKEIAENAQPVEETSKVDLKEEIKEIAENAQPVEETPKVDLKEEIKEIAENAQPVEETSKVDLKENFEEGYIDDGQTLKNILEMIAPTLDNNPRRIKQFINIFRFQRTIGHKIGLFTNNFGKPTEAVWNYKKLAKFVTINMKWPSLILALGSNTKLLEKLQDYALKSEEYPKIEEFKKMEEDKDLEKWIKDKKLIELLKSCFKGDNITINKAEYTLSDLDFSKLLEISPEVTFFDPSLEIVKNMKFIWIPAGEFMMGSPKDEMDRSGDEDNVRKVTIKYSFEIGKYPVTQKQWIAVMGYNPSWFKGDERPVENVSWNRVQEFIKKLNEIEGDNRYRLPSEAEWEYACRAGKQTRFSFGDDDSELWKYAWYGDYSEDQTHPVGQRDPNTWGLHDMHGNVWELVQDKYHFSYTNAPSNGDAREDSIGSDRVERGGSWRNVAGECRSAVRRRDGPDSHSDALGFRLLRKL